MSYLEEHLAEIEHKRQEAELDDEDLHDQQYESELAISWAEFHKDGEAFDRHIRQRAMLLEQRKEALAKACINAVIADTIRACIQDGIRDIITLYHTMSGAFVGKMSPEQFDRIRDLYAEILLPKSPVDLPKVLPVHIIYLNVRDNLRQQLACIENQLRIERRTP